jgi:hypothetical protein
VKRFLKKTVFYCLPLFILPVILYLIIDPFKVIYSYNEYVNTSKSYQYTQNRDYQSTTLYLKQYKKKIYDSFIFGNSRSLFYRDKTWAKYISGNIFHFDASGESLFGISGKLDLLKRKKVKINNALFVIDNSVLININNSDGHLFIKHPLVSNESSINFHYEMMKPFFSKALLAYLDIYLTGIQKNYMSELGITQNLIELNNTSNEVRNTVYDFQIKSNPSKYYKSRMNLFYKRDTILLFSPKVIGNEQKKLLRNISSILNENKTNFKLIISPLYDQKKLCAEDVNYLKSLFGTKNVCDFSGINSFTNDYKNYYEDSHYLPKVCDSILKKVYN